MTPDDLCKSGSEASHQTALFCWAALNLNKYPELKWLHAIPNGGGRGDSVRSATIRGGQLKAQGVKPGVSDIFLPVKRGTFSGLYIEMKKPDLQPKREGSKGGLSDEQIEFALFVAGQGFGFRACYTWRDAATMIEQYLNWGREQNGERSNRALS